MEIRGGKEEDGRGGKGWGKEEVGMTQQITQERGWRNG